MKKLLTLFVLFSFLLTMGIAQLVFAQEPPSLENHQFFGTVKWNASDAVPLKVIAKVSSREYASTIKDLSCAADTCNGTYGYTSGSAPDNTLRVQASRGESITFFVDTKAVTTTPYVPDGFTRLDLDLTAPVSAGLLGSVGGNETNETGCTPQWNCTGWSSCFAGWQNRSCSDVKNCNLPQTQPNETQRCTLGGAEETSCEYQWACGSWSACVGNLRTRSCTRTDTCDEKEQAGLVTLVIRTPAQDLEPCVSAAPQPTPSPQPTPASAPAPIASCFDRIKNQGETGVDCGGPCQPCPPAKEEGLPWYVFAVIGLGAALAILAAVYFLVLKRGSSVAPEVAGQLRTYFQKSLAVGTSKEEAAEKLIASGWDEKQVNKFLKKEKEL